MRLIELAGLQPEHAPNVAAALAHLSVPWSYVSSRQETQFKAPDTPSCTAVLRFLRSQNYLDLDRVKNGSRTVTLSETGG
jgi:hypothetical protein